MCVVRGKGFNLFFFNSVPKKKILKIGFFFLKKNFFKNFFFSIFGGENFVGGPGGGFCFLFWKGPFFPLFFQKKKFLGVFLTVCFFLFWVKKISRFVVVFGLWENKNKKRGPVGFFFFCPFCGGPFLAFGGINLKYKFANFFKKKKKPFPRHLECVGVKNFSLSPNFFPVFLQPKIEFGLKTFSWKKTIEIFFGGALRKIPNFEKGFFFCNFLKGRLFVLSEVGAGFFCGGPHWAYCGK